jgi:hypothetical protein
LGNEATRGAGMSIKVKFYNRLRAGRWSGGWKWRLGIHASEFKRKDWTVIVDLLIFSIAENHG